MNVIIYIGVALAAVAVIGVFVGPLLAAWFQERKRERDEKLKIHFEILQIEIMNPIRDLAWNLMDRDGELTYYEDRQVLSNDDIEQRDSFAYFTLHFPALAKEWRGLKEKALKHNHRLQGFKMRGKRVTALLEGVKAAADATGEDAGFDMEDAHNAYEERKQTLLDNAEELVKEFEEFSTRLAADIDNITLYEMGKRFKRLKDCPICQKF